MFPYVNNKSWIYGVTASWVTDPGQKKGSFKNNCLVKEVNPLLRVIHKIYSLVVCLERKVDSVARPGGRWWITFVLWMFEE